MGTWLKVLGLVVALPVLCVAGFFVAGFVMQPRFEPVDPADPPRYLAVVGLWDLPDGSTRCRAFYRSELDARPDSFPPIRYRLSAADFERCASAFRTFSREREWPEDLNWTRPARYAHLETTDSTAPSQLVLSYPPSEDHQADTRYRVDPGTGEPTDIEHRSMFGLAWGMGVVLFGGIGGIVAWIALVIAFTLRRRRQQS